MVTTRTVLALHIPICHDLSVLEVVEKYVKTLTLGTVVLDDDAGAADDLARVTLTVDLAQASPGTQHLRVTDLDQVDLVLGTESLDKLDVLGFRASLNQDTEMGLALVKSLRALTETTSEAIVNESVLQNLLKSILYGQLALRGFGRGLYLNGGLVDFDFISRDRKSVV